MVFSTTIEGVSAVLACFTGSADKADVELNDRRLQSRAAAKAGVFMSCTTWEWLNRARIVSYVFDVDIEKAQSPYEISGNMIGISDSFRNDKNLKVGKRRSQRVRLMFLISVTFFKWF